jgi:hypothetical protein
MMRPEEYADARNTFPPERNGMNFYQDAEERHDLIKYRLDGDERIDRVLNTLRGGIKDVNNGVATYNEEFRLMNELGIQRVSIVLQTGVNKINHLSKYKDDERIFAQVVAIMGDFDKELVSNLKVWAPEAQFKEGKLINPTMAKVRNKRIIVQEVENALVQSFLRANAGFEADITGKAYSVSEYRQQKDEDEKPRSFWGLGK